MQFDTTGFNFNTPQVPVFAPTLGNMAPLELKAAAVNLPGLAVKPFEFAPFQTRTLDIQTPSSAVSQGLVAAMNSLGQGISVGYQNIENKKQREQQQADKDREFAFQQQKYADEQAYKQRAEQRAEQRSIGERIQAVGGDLMPKNISHGPGSQTQESQTAVMSDVSPPKIEGAGVGGKPSIEITVPAPEPEVITKPKTLQITPKKLGDNVPSSTITPPTASDTLQVSPSFVTKPPVNATYIPPTPVETTASTPEQDAAMQEAIGSATARPIQEIAPYVGASLNGAPSMPLSQTTPPALSYHEQMVRNQKAQDEAVAASAKGQPLYNLDTSGMTQAQQEGTPQPKSATSRFEIPAPPAQAPQPYATTDYNDAVAHQTQDHGFYYGAISKLETHQDPQTGQMWYKVVPDQLSNTAIEAKIKHLDSMSEHYDRLQTQKQNVLNREQTGFSNDQRVKAFQAPNGMQQSFGRFVKDYDAIAKNPEGSGISDIGLLDMFGRAEGGGRITEGQAALALQSVGIMDKPELLLQKLKGGARLSQNQRDQMLRVIAEDHSAQANIANQAVQQTRDKLKAQGITDEVMLPQYFMTPITKWEAEEKQKELRSEVTQLKLQRIKAQESKDHKMLKQIEARGEEIKNEFDHLMDMQKRSKGSAIINSYDMEHTPQGWGGGSVMTFQAQ